MPVSKSGEAVPWLSRENLNVKMYDCGSGWLGLSADSSLAGDLMRSYGELMHTSGLWYLPYVVRERPLVLHTAETVQLGRERNTWLF